MVKERMGPIDRLCGVFWAGKRLVQVVVTGTPHLLDSKAPNQIERVRIRTENLLARVGKEPVADLERETGADRYDYSAGSDESYSMSELYKGPRSQSECEAEAKKVHEEYERRATRRGGNRKS